MFRRFVRAVRRMLQVLAPGWHPIRVAWIRRPLMAYVAWRRPEVIQTHHGFDLYIPRQDRSPVLLALFLEGAYEEEECAWIRSRLSSGDLVFDVGANVGFMTCLMALCIGSRGRVHAFEPDPDHFRALRRNLELNGLECVETVPKALAAQIGTATLYRAKENLGDHTLVPLPHRQEFEIQTTTFNAYRSIVCPGRQIRLVKIDVQGFELEVLEGMRSSLERQEVDYLLVEFWPARLRQSGSDGFDFLDLLAELPYQVEILTDTALGRYSDISGLRADLDHVTADPNAFFNLALTRRDLTTGSVQLTS